MSAPRCAIVALSAVFAAFAVACAARVSPDAAATSSSQTPDGWVAGATPRMLGEGVLSTPMNEFGGALSPDGREIYFTVSAERSYVYAICVSRFVDGRWTEPEVASFSSAGRNFDPVLSPDGRRIWFVSDRAPDGGLGTPPNPDLWVAERASADAPWGAPRRLDISSPTGTEWFASEALDGTLWISAARPDMPGVDLFRSRRVDGRYSPLEPVGAPLDSRGLEGEPMIAPDGSFVVFAAYERPGGFGHWDLWISHRAAGGWSDPVNLGPAVNGAARDYSPRLAPDGHTLLFTSERHFGLARAPGAAITTEALDAGLRGTTNGSGNIYAVDLRALGVLPRAQSSVRPSLVEPRLVGEGAVSTADYERGATITPDGRTMYFTRRLPNGYGSFVMESRRVGGRWGEPRVAPFSGRHADLDPFVTPDGRRLLFVSDRPYPGDSVPGDLDVWVAERVGDGWGEPRRVEGAVNGAGDESFPTADLEGTLWFSSARPGGGGVDIHRARRTSDGWAAPERLDSAINSPFTDTHPAISPDGRTLVFASVGRPDEAVQEGARYPRGDLYASTLANGRWTPARRLPDGVNTAAAELSPVFANGGRTLLFTSERGFALAPPPAPVEYRSLRRSLARTANGLGDIYEIDVAVLGLGATDQRASNGDVVLDSAGQPSPVARMLGAGTVSTDGNEFGGAMTPDGREVYFSVSVPRSYLYVICVSRRAGDGWTEPEVLPFSGRFRDFDPVLTPDARRMFFVSDRGDAASGGARARDYDIWFTDRGDDGRWGAPRRLGAPVGRSSDDGRANEWFASAAADGTLYFAAERPGGRGGADIWVARPSGDGYAEPELIGDAINGPGWESEPSIAPDGSFLVFSALGRAGGRGGWDIYISHRTASGWSAPRNLGPAVNTAARDYSPRLADGGRTLVFTSERHFLGDGRPPRSMDAAELAAALRAPTNGHGNLYTIDLQALLRSR